MSAESRPVEVPRVPQARRTRSLALRGALLVPFAGAAAFLAVWLFVAGSAMLAFVVTLLVAGLPFGSYLQVCGNEVRESRWDGAVLVVRTILV